MAAKPGVNVEDLENGLHTKKIKYRGKVYTLTELSYLDWQKTIKMATTVDPDTKLEDFDGDAHNAILIGKSVKVDGKKTTADVIFEEGAALVRQIIRDLNRLNTDEEKGEDVEDDGEGEVLAAASSSATGS